MGLKKTRELLAGAVPTIQSLVATKSSNVSGCHKRPLESTEPEITESCTDKRQRKSRAVQKLEINRVSENCFVYYMVVRQNFYHTPDEPV